IGLCAITLGVLFQLGMPLPLAIIITLLLGAICGLINAGLIIYNVVAPGFIETDMTRALSDDQRAGILAQVPAGRLGGAQEIASA
ncbi:hypothetical protein ONO12_26910, partial [Salmonella enterica subsp. enterica serovar Montevideo]|nr:hypothetical protein [Salmonella enterica subsp. enterica serovar Montevideo]